MAEENDENKKESFISRKDLSNLREAQKSQSQILKGMEDEIFLKRELRTLSNDIASQMRNELTYAEEKTDALRNAEELSKSLKATNNLIEQAEQEIIAAKKAGNMALASTIKRQQEGLILTKDEIKAQTKLRKEVDKKMGLIDNIADAIKSIPGVGGALKKTMDNIVAGQEKSILAGEKGFGRIKSAAKSVGPAVKEFFGAGSLILIAKSILAADQAISDFQKNLGISAKEAGNLRLQFGAATTSMAVTSIDMMKTFSDINAQLGIASTAIRTDIIAEMSKLGKLTGMSAESQASFAMFAQKSGIHAEKLTDEARQAVMLGETERGVRLDINKTLDEAGKITGVIRANLGFNIVAISEAVAATKQFGLSLGDLEGISKNLLNFQSSIEAELTAELFTGKQLELSAARRFALTADYKNLSKEIVKQAGGEYEFAKLNVLEKEKLAAALGMSVNRMSDLVYQNANLKELAEQARDAGKDELANMLERRSVGESFNDIMMQLKTIFVDLMTPLLPVLESFSELVQNSESFRENLKYIATIGLGAMVAGITKAAIAAIIGGGALAGPIGAVAGIAVAMMALNTINKAGDEASANMPRYNTLQEGKIVNVNQPSIFDSGEVGMRKNTLTDLQNNNNSITKEQANTMIDLLSTKTTFEFTKFAAAQMAVVEKNKFS